MKLPSRSFSSAWRPRPENTTIMRCRSLVSPAMDAPASSFAMRRSGPAALKRASGFSCTPRSRGEGSHEGHHHFIPAGLIADVEGDAVRLSATVDAIESIFQTEEGEN